MSKPSGFEVNPTTWQTNVPSEHARVCLHCNTPLVNLCFFASVSSKLPPPPPTHFKIFISHLSCFPWWAFICCFSNACHWDCIGTALWATIFKIQLGCNFQRKEEKKRKMHLCICDPVIEFYTLSVKTLHILHWICFPFPLKAVNKYMILFIISYYYYY